MLKLDQLTQVIIKELNGTESFLFINTEDGTWYSPKTQNPTFAIKKIYSPFTIISDDGTSRKVGLPGDFVRIDLFLRTLELVKKGDINLDDYERR